MPKTCLISKIQNKKTLLCLEEYKLSFPHTPSFLFCFIDLTRNLRAFLYRVNKTTKTCKASSIRIVHKPRIVCKARREGKARHLMERMCGIYV